MSTEDEKLMKGKKSDIKLNTARKTESMSYICYRFFIYSLTMASNNVNTSLAYRDQLNSGP